MFPGPVGAGDAAFPLTRPLSTRRRFRSQVTLLLRPCRSPLPASPAPVGLTRGDRRPMVDSHPERSLTRGAMALPQDRKLDRAAGADGRSGRRGAVRREGEDRGGRWSAGRGLDRDRRHPGCGTAGTRRGRIRLFSGSAPDLGERTAIRGALGAGVPARRPPGWRIPAAGALRRRPADRPRRTDRFGPAGKHSRVAAGSGSNRCTRGPGTPGANVPVRNRGRFPAVHGQGTPDHAERMFPGPVGCWRRRILQPDTHSLR